MPEIEIAGPDVDLGAAREYGAGGVLSALTNADDAARPGQSRRRAVADLRKQAAAEVPMRLRARRRAQAIERSFAMPLTAAGIKDAKVVARLPTEEGTDDLAMSTVDPYNEVIEEARAPTRRSSAEDDRTDRTV